MVPVARPRVPATPHVRSGRRPSAMARAWGFRELLRSLVVRDLKVKYQRSALGFLWTLLNPAITVVILVAVFRYVVRIPIEGYWAFLLSGYFVWNFVSQVIAAGPPLLDAHAGLIRSVAFPKEVLVLGAVASRFVEFLLEMLLVLAALAIFHHGSVPASFALVPLLFFLQLLVAAGLALPLTSLAAFYYDVRHVLPIVLMMWFYASPVFYPASFVPEGARLAYFANPLAGLLTLFHHALYEGTAPPPGVLAGVAAVAVLIFAVGHVLFDRHQSTFAELV